MRKTAKMSWIRRSLTLYIIAISIQTHAAPTDRKDKENILLGKAMKTLMDYKDVPQKDMRSTQSPYGRRMIPKFMTDLYERYENRDVFVDQLRTANTVRSIFADIGIVKSNNMFLFNLSCMDTEEDFIHADVHIYKKKKQQNADISITLYQLNPPSMTEVGNYLIKGESYGWQVIPVAEAVNSILNSKHNTPHIFALDFSRNPNKSWRLKGFARHLSRPFLVVYSNSDTNVTKDHISPKFEINQADDTFVNPETGKYESFGRVPYRKTQPSTEKGKLPFGSSKFDKKDSDFNGKDFGKQKQKVKFDDTGRPIYKNYKEELLNKKLSKQKLANEATRTRRSVLDNEIPEDPSAPLLPEEARKSSTHKSKGKHRENKPFKMSDFDIKVGSYLYSQYFPNSKDNDKQTRKHRKQHKLSKSKDSQSIFDLPIPENWDFGESDVISSYMQQTAFKNKLCKKRQSRLDFADIGWSEWIIAPKSFDLNFCAGSCSLSKQQSSTSTTNHAALQIIAHAVGIDTNLPPPCCVPAVTSSKSMLYFHPDQTTNVVVLKNYPNMVVESCQCL